MTDLDVREVYAWGSGNYGRLGLGHSRDARVPHRVTGVLNGCDVATAACGWYHSAVATASGDVAVFGSRVTKCLGVVASEASDASDGAEPMGASADFMEEDEAAQGINFADTLQPEGIRRRRTAANTGAPGSTDYLQSAGPGKAGRSTAASRRRGGAGTSPGNAALGPPRSTASFVPQILRSFPSRVTVVQVAVGGDMLGAHTLAVSRNGRLYSWGYGPACGLGSVNNVSTPTMVTKFLGTGVGDAGSGRGQFGREEEPRRWHGKRYRYKPPTGGQLGLQVLRPRIVKASCGGGFSVVMSSEGEVFTFGLSAGGRLGFRTKFRAQLRPRRLENLGEGTTDLAAGAGFVVLCSAAGRLVTWGDNSKGQLGIGSLQESYEPVALAQACPSAFVFQSIAAGDSHALALDSAGRTYSWGGEGGPMTGQGQPLSNSVQVDLAFKFRLRSLPYWWVRPRPVRSLASCRVVHIDAGCLHSLALTQDGVLFAWGAMLQAGGCGPHSKPGADRPEASWVPRLLAPGPKLPLVRIGAASAGGWHSLATAAPSCPFEQLLEEEMLREPSDQKCHSFCQGRLVSQADSLAGLEACVHVCCPVVRARLALPNGVDSPIWRALSAQIRRRPPPVPPIGADDAAAATVAAATDAPATLLRSGSGAPSTVAEEQEEEAAAEAAEEETSEDTEECLMDIVAMHREAVRSSPSRPQPRQHAFSRRAADAAAPMRSDAADEAAGKAKRPVSSLMPPKAAPKAVPIFSSDSSASDTEAAPASRSATQPVTAPHGRPPPRGTALRERRRLASRMESQKAPSRPTTALVPPRRPVVRPDFSSDDSSTSSDSAGATATAGAQRHPWRRRPNQPFEEASGGTADIQLELQRYGLAVLAALVRFLYTDCLVPLEVVDDDHPLFLREQQLRHELLTSQAQPAEERAEGKMEEHQKSDAEEDEEAAERRAAAEQFSKERAEKGLLRRAEIADLRLIGQRLQMERLVRLCDQALLRLDAPGAPALFVPASTLGAAMWTLLAQTASGPSSDGIDVCVLCSPPSPASASTAPDLRRGAGQRAGLRRSLPADGKLWAHSFMLYAGCAGIRVGGQAEAEGGSGGLRRLAGAGCRLEWAGPSAGTTLGGAIFYLDLRDVATEVAFAWLQYLYTQDDLELVWPCSDHGAGTTAETSGSAGGDRGGEAFWMELLCLAQRVGDDKLLLYAQDTLVGAVSPRNWARLAAFSERVQCPVLTEATLSAGLRQLLPGMLASFHVPTGLEHLDDPEDGAGSDGSTFAEGQAATVGRATAGRPGASWGTIDLELEKRLFERWAATHGPPSTTNADGLAQLKRSSPGHFAELKQRLVESITSAQQAAANLHKCAQFFDSHEKRGFQRDGSARQHWMELFALLVLVSFFVIPLVFKQSFLTRLLTTLRPIYVKLPAAPRLSDFLPFEEATARVVGFNGLMVLMLLAILYSGLKN